MPQTSYSTNMPKAYAGMLAQIDDQYTTSRLNKTVAVPFGLAVAQMAGVDDQCRLPFAHAAAIVFSGNLITGNSVACSINGVALSATAFNTDNATTLSDLATKIAAQTGVASAVSNGTTTITVTMNADTALLVSGVVVTGGAGQATAAITHTTTDVVLGLSQFDHRQPTTIGGTAQYEAGSEVAIVEKGVMWVNAEGAVTRGNQAYIRIATGSGGSQLGAIRGDADSGTAVALGSSRFVTSTTGAGLAQLEFNLP